MSTPPDIVTLDPTSARIAPYRGVGSEIVRWICNVFLAFGGWKREGDWPSFDKLVVVAAPHTSNWDGINMLAIAGAYRVKLSFMGKKSLTTGPFGWVMLRLGCVPVDRSKSQDLVQSMAAAFAEKKRMALAIPPEGTRSLVHEWKSGFYHIARGADVPILLAVLDYAKRTIRLAAILRASGDYESDLAAIKRFYADAQGKRPKLFSAT
jgi:1-acyl-sn-glycerol-3-phosphate acyltransferase